MITPITAGRHSSTPHSLGFKAGQHVSVERPYELQQAFFPQRL
jgi:hypothetical protein